MIQVVTFKYLSLEGLTAPVPDRIEGVRDLEGSFCSTRLLCYIKLYHTRLRIKYIIHTFVSYKTMYYGTTGR
jgi:hypothetical protein